MQKAKYTAEFKEKAVRQVIDRGHSVIDVSQAIRNWRRPSVHLGQEVQGQQ